MTRQFHPLSFPPAEPMTFRLWRLIQDPSGPFQQFLRLTCGATKVQISVLFSYKRTTQTVIAGTALCENAGDFFDCWKKMAEIVFFFPFASFFDNYRLSRGLVPLIGMDMQKYRIVSSQMWILGTYFVVLFWD